MSGVEGHGVDSITEDERTSRPSEFAWIWHAAQFSFGTVVLGALPIVFGLSWWAALAVIVAGSAVGSLLIASLVRLGLRTGSNDPVSSGAHFGVRGRMVGSLAGHRPAAARRCALDLLDAVGMAAQADRRPHQLSGGQRQRVNIARALRNIPTALLIDEPTSALDHERGATIIELITQLTHQQATATILVTHDRTHLTSADQITEVRDGRLLGMACSE